MSQLSIEEQMDQAARDVEPLPLPEFNRVFAINRSLSNAQDDIAAGPLSTAEIAEIRQHLSQIQNGLRVAEMMYYS